MRSQTSAAAFGLGATSGVGAGRPVAVSGDAALAVGQVSAPEAPDRAIGQVVSVAGSEALAVMPLDGGEGPFVVAGVSCRPLPLMDGLAR